MQAATAADEERNAMRLSLNEAVEKCAEALNDHQLLTREVRRVVICYLFVFCCCAVCVAS